MKATNRTLGRLLPGTLLAAMLLVPNTVSAEEVTELTNEPILVEDTISSDIPSDDAAEEVDETDAPPNPTHMWNVDESSEDGIMVMASSPYWENTSGGKAFYDGDGKLFASPALFVIDVSEHQGRIDWGAFHAENPDAGVILRLGYGAGDISTGEQVDAQFARNLSELKRLGIPYGVYLYSYAYDTAFAANEACFTADVLETYDADPVLGIFYDLEAWSWTGHQHPTSPSAYEPIVRTYFDTLIARGYDEDDIHVYSYTSYLQNELNSDYIHARTTWVAQYWSRLTYDITAEGQYGWQYTASGRVAGVAGNVDMNAFSALESNDSIGVPLTQLGTKVTDLPEGDYILLSGLSGLDGNGNSAMDIGWSSQDNGTAVSLFEFGNTENQIFHVKPNGDGSYTITAKHSGKALDLPGSATKDGTPINQWDVHGGNNQRWTIYRDSVGYCYIASVCAGDLNKVMTVSDGNAANGTPIELWAADGSNAQRFRLIPRSEYVSGRDGMFKENGASYWYEDGIRVEGRDVYDASAGGWRWFEVCGKMAINKDVFIPSASGGKWVRLDENGLMVKGEDYRYGAWYYFDEWTGEMAKGVRHVDAGGGKWVYYDVTTGKMAHGEAYLSYDANHIGWYYFDEWTGEMYHGDRYLESSGGKWVRYDHYTGIMVKGLQKWDGSWYYFDSTTGAMAHGDTWVPDWNRWHHFDEWTGRG